MRRLRKRGPANFDNFGHKRLAAYIGEVTAWQNHFVTFIEAQADEGENFSDVCERLGDNHQIVHAYDFWIAEGERADASETINRLCPTLSVCCCGRETASGCKKYTCNRT